MSPPRPFDPYALFEALDRERFGYAVIGAFARVVHGSAETTRGLDIVPSLREESVRRLVRVLEDLQATADGKPVRPDQLATTERTRLHTRAGELSVVPTPWGTRGYDDLRIRSNRENLGRGIHAPIASVVDLARMLDASARRSGGEGRNTGDEFTVIAWDAPGAGRYPIRLSRSAWQATPTAWPDHQEGGPTRSPPRTTKMASLSCSSG